VEAGVAIAAALAAGSVALLGFGLDSLIELASASTGASHPGVSWPGVVVSAGAIVVMPMLARAKGRVAAQLGSGATAGDAAQSCLCAIIAAAALVSNLANAALGWWWLDRSSDSAATSGLGA
jgi:divalent metal cation (Fe/Co/Zn/Cd) transporter